MIKEKQKNEIAFIIDFVKDNSILYLYSLVSSIIILFVYVYISSQPYYKHSKIVSIIPPFSFGKAGAETGIDFDKYLTEFKEVYLVKSFEQYGSINKEITNNNKIYCKEFQFKSLDYLNIMITFKASPDEIKNINQLDECHKKLEKLIVLEKKKYFKIISNTLEELLEKMNKIQTTYYTNNTILAIQEIQSEIIMLKNIEGGDFLKTNQILQNIKRTLSTLNINMMQNEMITTNIRDSLKFISSEKLFNVSDQKFETSAYQEQKLLLVVSLIFMINFSLFTFIGIIRK